MKTHPRLHLFIYKVALARILSQIWVFSFLFYNIDIKYSGLLFLPSQHSFPMLVEQPTQPLEN